MVFGDQEARFLLIVEGPSCSRRERYEMQEESKKSMEGAATECAKPHLFVMRVQGEKVSLSCCTCNV